MSKANKQGCGAAILIGLILLFAVLNAILFAQVDSDMPTYEEGEEGESYEP